MKRSMELNVAHADAAWTEKLQRLALDSEAYFYAGPDIDPYFNSADGERTGYSSGQPRNDHLFDATLANAMQDHANELCFENFTPGTRWAAIEMGDQGLTGEEFSPSQQREGMQRAVKRMFGAIHRSNFYKSAVVMAPDGCTAGTGIMKGGISRDKGSLLEFEAVCQAECALEPGIRNGVGGLHRKMRLSRDHIKEYWPDGTPPPEERGDMSRSGKPKLYRVQESSYYDVDEGIWHESVIIRDAMAGGRQFHEVYARDYVVWPWIVWRYAVLPGEVYGRSPAQKAVPSARTVNYAKKVRLETASIRAVPAYTYLSEGGFNPQTVQIGPGVFIGVASNAHENPTIKALEMAGDVPLNELVIADEREAIEQIMKRNVMPDVKGPVHSPTEYLERRKEHERRRGADSLNLLEEVGKPVLRLTAFLLQEAGQLKELDALNRRDGKGNPLPLKMDGTDLKVSFNSPLVKLQRLQDAQNVIQWGESIAAAFGPEALMAGARIEKVAEVLAELMKVPKELYRTEEEQKAMLARQMATQSQPARPVNSQAGDMA